MNVDMNLSVEATFRKMPSGSMRHPLALEHSAALQECRDPNARSEDARRKSVAPKQSSFSHPHKAADCECQNYVTRGESQSLM